MPKQLIECSTPGCYSCFFYSDDREYSDKYMFCPECRKEHSYHVLITQAEHENDIKKIILDARMFNSAAGMADYIGVSFVTIYHWIRKYFGITFQEFKRNYICKSNKCYLVNINGSPYSRGDYVLKKVRDKRYCACINELGKNHMMTNAPVSVVHSIIGKELKVSDFYYKKPLKLYPVYMSRIISPVYMSRILSPIYV